MSETRKIAAILVADVVGYSRLAGADEERTLARLRALRSDPIDPAIALHRGRSVKRTGDGSLIEFRSVVDAARCAIEVQHGMAERNVGLPSERRIEFRVGIHLGDVVEESDGDLMGDGVNIAARLEGLAEPGGIMISGAAYDQLQGKLDVPLEFVGEQNLKNIARPVRAFRLRPDKKASMPRSRSPAVGGRHAMGSRCGAGADPGPRRLAFLAAQSRPGHRWQAFARGAAVRQPRRRRRDGSAGRWAHGDIITELSRYRAMDVIAHNSTEQYKGKAVDVRQVGKDLNVRYVLEGSVQRDGDQIRVTAQLIDCGEQCALVVGALGSAFERILRRAERNRRPAGKPSRRRGRAREGRQGRRAAQAPRKSDGLRTLSRWGGARDYA